MAFGGNVLQFGGEIRAVGLLPDEKPKVGIGIEVDVNVEYLEEANHADASTGCVRIFACEFFSIGGPTDGVVERNHTAGHGTSPLP